MKKKTIDAAYHEAGHVVALILINRRFKYVTIVPEENKDDPFPVKTLGHVKEYPLKNKYQWEINYFFDPSVIDKYLKDDFTKVAGIIAEKIHTGKFNNLGARGDFRNWVDTTLHDLPEKLSLSYQKFLLEYTKVILEMNINWIRITAVAEALLERKTLSYNQVWEVIRKRIDLEINKNKN